MQIAILEMLNWKDMKQQNAKAHEKFSISSIRVCVCVRAPGWLLVCFNYIVPLI